MKKLIPPALILTILTGCSSIPPQYQYTTRYGGVGALAGAAVGAVINHDNRGQGAVLGGALGAAGGAGYGYYVDQQESELRSKMLGSGITVKRDGDKINLILPENIAFQPGGYRLTAQAQRALDEVATSLQRYPGSSLVVTSSTNASKPHAGADQLFGQRAAALTSYLMAKGVEPSRVSIQASVEQETSRTIARNSTYQVQPANIQQQVQMQQAQLAQQRRQYQYTPTPVYQAPYTASASTRVLSNTIMQGISQAISNGPAAGLRSGAATAARGASQELNRGINGAVRDFQYNSFDR